MASIQKELFLGELLITTEYIVYKFNSPPPQRFLFTKTGLYVYQNIHMRKIYINVINLEKIKIRLPCKLVPTQGRNSINEARQSQLFPQYFHSVVNCFSYSLHHELLEGRHYVMCTFTSPVSNIYLPGRGY